MIKEEEILNQAIQLHHTGKLNDAENLYRQILSGNPCNDKAIYFLGIIAYQVNQVETAIEYISKAIDINPSPEYYKDLGNIYFDLDRKQDAINCYLKVIQHNPDPDLFFNLGLLFIQTNNFNDAISCFENLIKFNPNDYEAYFNLGYAYNKINRQNKAIHNYERSLSINPDNLAIYNELGILYAKSDRIKDSIQCYKKIIQLDPNNPDAYYNLGNSLKNNQDIENAINAYKKAVELKPDFAEALNNLGILLNKEDFNDEAIGYLNKAITLKPDYADAYNNLGIALNDKKQIDEAIKCYNKALEINPLYIEAYNNLGKALLDKDDIEGSLSIYQKLLEIKPDYAEAYNNLGNVLSSHNDIDKAIECFKKAMKLKPDYAEAYINLGKAYYDKLDIEASVKCYQNLIDLKRDYPQNDIMSVDPYYAEAVFGLSVMNLLTGDLKKGWEYYESRFYMSKGQRPSIPVFTKPQLKNIEDARNKTVYVHHEQGFGDTIQFARFLPLLYSQGAKVLFKPQKGLERVLQQSDLKAEIIDSSTLDDYVSFDFYIPIMSLPNILKTTIETIPYKEGYLKADPEKVNFYKEKYFNNNNFKIGIFWQGKKTHINDKNRSILLKHFFKLSELEKIKMYSFQKGPGIEQLENIPDKVKIINLGETFNDFSDTAAAMKNLDLFIAIDTSVAHLAGSLGIPTWILVPFIPEWRWLLNTDKSYWYDSVRLFRQKSRGNWDELINTVVQSLRDLLQISA